MHRDLKISITASLAKRTSRKDHPMPACPQMTFSNISPEKYETLLATAQSQGLNLTGYTGATTYQGMTFNWNYDLPTQSLTLHCTEKPFFVPCSVIEQKIRALIG